MVNVVGVPLAVTASTSAGIASNESIDEAASTSLAVRNVELLKDVVTAGTWSRAGDYRDGNHDRIANSWDDLLSGLIDITDDCDLLTVCPAA